MNFRPLHDRVLIKRFSQEEKTTGGLIIPTTSDGGSSKATVIAVGTGYRSLDGTTVPLTVKEGDIVMLSQWAGEKVILNGEDFLVVEEEKISGILAA